MTEFLWPPYIAPFDLTDATTIATDAEKGTVFRVTITASRTLGAPTNARDSMTRSWEIKQHSSGGPYTITLATGTGGFSFGTTIPSANVVLSTAASAVDILTARYDSASQRWRVIGFVKGYA